MDKFKVGDKVKIRKSDYYSSSYAKYSGGITTIIVDCEKHYYLDIDKGRYRWYDYELELYKEEITEQPKEYDIHNLLNDFPEGTQFINSLGIKYKVLGGDLYYYKEVYIPYKWREVRYSSSIKQILNMKFTKIEESKLKSMTFDEAVKTGGRLKFVHTNYKMIEEFMCLDNILQYISTTFLDCSIKDIILDGIWYAEGVYE